jgi:hypothetical protein
MNGGEHNMRNTKPGKSGRGGSSVPYTVDPTLEHGREADADKYRPVHCPVDTQCVAIDDA